MLIFHFTQTTEGQDKYRVDIALEGSRQLRQMVTASLDFKLAPQEQGNLRWYSKISCSTHKTLCEISWPKVKEYLPLVGRRNLKMVYPSMFKWRWLL